jgi:hypothetical protein
MVIMQARHLCAAAQSPAWRGSIRARHRTNDPVLVWLRQMLRAVADGQADHRSGSDPA